MTGTNFPPIGDAIEINPHGWNFFKTNTKFVYFCQHGLDFHIGYVLFKNNTHGIDRKYFVYPNPLVSLRQEPCMTKEEMFEKMTLLCFDIEN
jgi:hypothetical protein